MSYAAFARRLRATGLVPDPWLHGEPRFAEEPVILSAEDAEAICVAAEGAGRAVDAACAVLAEDPELAERFLGLTPVQGWMWQIARPQWHGYARADVFRCTDGRWRVCEINADTPTGQPEAVALGQLAHQDHPHLIDPNSQLEQRFSAMVRQLAAMGLDQPLQTAGIVYATEFTEDLSVIQLFQLWLERLGCQVVLGSPWNLALGDDGRPTLLGKPCDVIVRHYKTDWWAERLSEWEDGEPFEDPRPFAAQLELLLRAQLERRVVVINPFGAVVAQNKRLFALLWERMDLFDPAVVELVQAFIPETRRLDAMHPDQLLAEQAQWVLKSDYGCEGLEVVIGAQVRPEEWAASLRLAVPERWIAQRYFDASVEENGRTTNFGPYLIAGQVAGMFVRQQSGATDVSALSVPVLVSP